MHLSVVVGKEVVKQYYGSAHKRAYYMGCSQGPYKLHSRFAMKLMRWSQVVVPGAFRPVDPLGSTALTSYRFKEMQTFPDEFDGLVSPGYDRETCDALNK